MTSTSPNTTPLGMKIVVSAMRRAELDRSARDRAVATRFAVDASIARKGMPIAEPYVPAKPVVPRPPKSTKAARKDKFRRC